MSLFHRHQPPEPPEASYEARKALNGAFALREHILREDPFVNQVGNSLKDLREANHLRDKMIAIMRGEIS